MSNLAVFEFEGKSVRVVEIDGEPWFVASDVLAAIGSQTKVTELKALIIEDLGDGFVTTVPISDSLGRKQHTLVLSEPGLTLFVSRSRTSLGKAMNRWIHTEVLPTLRKTGTYATVRPISLPTPAPAPAPTPASATPPISSTLLPSAVATSHALLLDAGIDPRLASSWILGHLIESDPAGASAYSFAKKALSASMPVESPPLSPTQLGEKIAEQLGLEKPVSARKVNEALEKLGLQSSQSDAKGRKQWVLTPAGKEHGEVLTDTAAGHGKTIFSVRWRDTVLSLLSRDVDWVQI